MDINIKMLSLHYISFVLNYGLWVMYFQCTVRYYSIGHDYVRVAYKEMPSQGPPSVACLRDIKCCRVIIINNNVYLYST